MPNTSEKTGLLAYCYCLLKNN